MKILNEKGEITESGGIGFVGLLQVCFIVLKVMNIINWSWFKVFLPLIISMSLPILLIIIVIIHALLSN